MAANSTGTVHGAALRHVADIECEKNPDFAAHVVRTLKWMKSGVYPAYILDSIVQKSRGPYSHYDAYAMAKFDMNFFGGNIAIAEVPIGDTPSPDGNRAENQAKLDRLSSPFRAVFEGGHGDEDGYVSFDGEVEFQICEGWGETVSRRFAREGRHIPLEVGTTSASRSLLHLKQDMGLVRWPYGYRSCYVFLYFGSSAGLVL